MNFLVEVEYVLFVFKVLLLKIMVLFVIFCDRDVENVVLFEKKVIVLYLKLYELCIKLYVYNYMI